MASWQQYQDVGISKTLSAIFLEKGFLTTKQVSAIHRLQGKQDSHYIRGYTLEKKLGQGGIGEVYLGRQDSLGRQVAIKILFPHMLSNPDHIKRFMREARISVQLDHSNIVRGLDFGEADGYYFFVMEYIQGPSLRGILAQQKNHFRKPGLPDYLTGYPRLTIRSEIWSGPSRYQTGQHYDDRRGCAQIVRYGTGQNH